MGRPIVVRHGFWISVVGLPPLLVKRFLRSLVERYVPLVGDRKSLPLSSTPLQLGETLHRGNMLPTENRLETLPGPSDLPAVLVEHGHQIESGQFLERDQKMFLRDPVPRHIP